ncbi:Glycerol kinase [Corynebacterium capitovis DSM 44611]|uniref:hypothetical protein n=1 Tax=Corynebacterium capitovis TaxID=131081 RepID=UPI00036933AA|nr:hypothetical protein [Corynebacterium capitovis]WKD58293.1 Glycerol kinase [Corynebacterium capitovis DSM 44611]
MVRPGIIETTVMGAASAAGIGASLIDAPVDLGARITWKSKADPAERGRLISGWSSAVERSYNQSQLLLDVD